MSLEDDLAAAKKDRQREECSVRMLLIKIDTEAARMIGHAIMDPTISPAKLSQVIEKHTGIQVGDYSIRRHRGGRCKCPRIS